MKYRFFPGIFFVLIALLASCSSVPSTGRIDTVTTISGKKGSIALFPITGGSIEDGETIISRLGRQGVMYDAFEKITVLTRSNITALNFERNFQQYSYLTDPDSIFQIGRDLNAAYVIAGYLTKLGNRNLIILSIMEVETLRQIAGEYRIYNTLSEINSMIPELANNLVAAVSLDTSDLPGLSVPPFVISIDGSGQNDAMVLAQILACELSTSGSFAVLPRTDNIQTVLAEYQRQRSGIINTEGLSRFRAGYNAEYVLSGKVERLGDINMFAADILNIEDGSIRVGYDVEYRNFSQESITLMQELAARLTNRMSDADARRAAEARQRQLDADAAAQRRQQAADAAAKAKAEAEAAEAARKAAAWSKTVFNATRHYEQNLNVNYHWGDDIIGGSGMFFLPFNFSPFPFSSIGLGAKFGAIKKGDADAKFFGGGNISAGLVFPFSSDLKLFGDAVLELGYFGGLQGTLASWVTPGFRAGIDWFDSYEDGSYDIGIGFEIRYQGTWFESNYLHSVGIGLIWFGQ